MAKRGTGRAAWIVEWVTYSDKIKKVLDPRPHILPHRWTSDRVKDYMRVLYWNSPLFKPFGTLENVNLPSPPGIFKEDMRYGDATHLWASYVTDLMISEDGSKAVLEWTAPGRSEFNRQREEFIKVSPPIRRRVELQFNPEG